MKILSLEITNLTSLKGNHFLNLEELSQKGIFGITGDTGSGKSTLLNAITLALYGKIFKKSLIQSDLVTLGEKEGVVKLTFITGQARYQATWRCVVRKKTGEILTVPRTERFLYRHENDQWMLLKDNAESVIQLSFDQFCKCIILNQGEFARFILSSFNERKEILEKLYSGETLDKVAEFLKKKIQHKQEILAKYEIEIHTLGSQNPENIDKIENEILALELENSQIQIEINEKTKELSLLHNLIDLSKKHLLSLSKKMNFTSQLRKKPKTLISYKVHYTY